MVYSVSIHFPAKFTTANQSIRNNASAFVVVIQQVDPSLAVFSLTDKTLPPLLSGTSFPTAHLAFLQYFTIPNCDSRNTKVHAFFQSTGCLNQIKFNQFIHIYIKQL